MAGAAYHDDLVAYLGAAPIIYAYAPSVHGGGGHGNKFAVVLDGGITLLAKPSHGVADGGEATRNEVAAWEVARLLGWSSLVSATVLRTIPSPGTPTPVETALQVLWPGYDFTPPLSTFSPDEVWRAAIFDWVIQHTDRRANNWLGVPPVALPFHGALSGGPQHLKLIDHGYAFDYPGRAFSSEFFTRHKGERLPPDARPALVDLRDELDASPLGTLISADSMIKLKDRVAELLSTGMLPSA